MARLTKKDLLGGSDLREEEFTPSTLDGSVLVRGLGAEFSNQAQSEATEIVTDERGRQTVQISKAKMERIQLRHGLVDPAIETDEEAAQVMSQYGPAAREIIEKIDDLSGLDKESIAKAEATFPGGSESEEGAGDQVDGDGAGDSGSVVSARTGD